MRGDIPLEYKPDAPITEQGVIKDCSAFIPTTEGYVAAPSEAGVGMDTLAAECRGAAAAVLLSGGNRLFAGTSSAIYERAGTSWTNRSKSGGYTGGSDSVWRFAQYGNITLATNGTDNIQASNTSGNFADLAGSPPKAGVIFTVGNFIMTMDYDDGVDDFADGWYCSGIGNHEEWDTTDVATQSAKGRLLDIPGQIRAGARLGDQAVAYKDGGIWLGTFQGAPIVWNWQFVPGGAGCVSQEALVEVTVNGGNAHIFMGRDDIYLFDGSRPISIATGKVRQYLQSNLSHQYRYKTKAVHDRANALVRFYFVGKGGGATEPDTCLVYNYRTNQWGRDDRSIQAALEYITASITWDGMGSLYSTWDDLPDISYDSPFWSATQEVAAVFNSSNELVSLTGNAGTSTFRTGDLGDDVGYTTLRRVRLKFNGPNTATGTMTNYYKHEGDDTATTGATIAMNGTKFDLLRSARWHSMLFTMSGDYKVTGAMIDFRGSGRE